MTHGSLFSGIGGFDLAAQWMGWENRFHCEWNEFGKRVLKYYWPKADSHDDITKTDFTKYNGTIDLISGGFPCQPYSSAGKRLGKADDRHLWPHMLRAIKEVAPRWVVGENVRGLTNWNGGLVFDEVCADLENLGYQVAPYLIPACAVNAPHRRERIWFVAYSNGSTKKYNRRTNERTSNEIWRENQSNVSREFCSDGNASDTDSVRCGRRSEQSKSNQSKEWQICENKQYHSNGIRCKVEGCGRNTFNADVKHTNCIRQEWGMYEDKSENAIRKFIGKSNAWINQRESWHNFPTQSPICSGDDGLPTELDGITFSKWRNESIKAYGNAVVPQVVYQIFKAIEQYETTQRNTSNSNR